MNIAEELRKEGRASSDLDDKRFIYYTLANQIESAVASFYREPTDDRLRDVNRLWARASRLLGFPVKNDFRSGKA